MTALVRYNVEGSVARLTLDSPENRNALSTALRFAANVPNEASKLRDACAASHAARLSRLVSAA